jgi:hypothetical protein
MPFIEPRPSDPDVAVVTDPDNVSHYVCEEAPWRGATHHVINGKCHYCKYTVMELKIRYGIR